MTKNGVLIVWPTSNRRNSLVFFSFYFLVVCAMTPQKLCMRVAPYTSFREKLSIERHASFTMHFTTGIGWPMVGWTMVEPFLFREDSICWLFLRPRRGWRCGDPKIWCLALKYLPPWMVETLWRMDKNEISHLSTGAGFLPTTVCWIYIYIYHHT